MIWCTVSQLLVAGWWRISSASYPIFLKCLPCLPQQSLMPVLQVCRKTAWREQPCRPLKSSFFFLVVFLRHHRRLLESVCSYSVRSENFLISEMLQNLEWGKIIVEVQLMPQTLWYASWEVHHCSVAKTIQGGRITVHFCRAALVYMKIKGLATRATQYKYLDPPWEGLSRMYCLILNWNLNGTIWSSLVRYSLTSSSRTHFVITL